MARRLISVSEDVYNRLEEIRDGRSFSKTIAILLERRKEDALGEVQQALKRHEQLLTQILQLLQSLRREHVNNMLTSQKSAQKEGTPENRSKLPDRCPYCGKLLTEIERVTGFLPGKGVISFDRCPYCHRRL